MFLNSFCKVMPYTQSKRRFNQLLSLQMNNLLYFFLSKAKKKNNLTFSFCLDLDPKQIISEPDPGKSSEFNRIRIHRTAKYSRDANHGDFTF